MGKARKLLTVVLVTALISSLLTGCGANTAETTNTAAEATTETAGDAATKSEDTAKSEESSGEVVEIEYLNHKTEEAAIDAMDQLIAKFNEENPTIKVTQTTTADFETVLTTRAQTNEMPDIFSCSTNNTYEVMFEEGLIMDLTGQSFLNNVAEDTLALSAYKDKNWRLPYALSAYGLFIRTDIFEEQNIPIPTTYEELMAAAEKLQQAGITPFICADKDLGVVGQRMERIMGIINDDADTEFRQIVAGDLLPEDSTTLTTYAKVQAEIAKYTTSDSAGVDQEASYQNFVNGEGAMLINGTWTLSSLKTYNPDIQVVMIPFPNPTGGDTKVPISIDTSFAISGSTKHADACLAFLNFLSQAENAQIYCDNEGSPNVINGVNYGITEFSTITEKMANGEIFVSLNAIWPSGLRNTIRDFAQQLILDQDEDAFVKSTAEVLPEFYTE